jgi:hypothetical protein
MKTNPQHVIRKCGNQELFMDKAGKWSTYDKAKRFRSQDNAEKFAAKHTTDAIGLFPCSTPYTLLNWNVRTYDNAGKFTGYLKDRDRTTWRKRAARRQMADFVKRHADKGVTAELELDITSTY